MSTFTLPMLATTSGGCTADICYLMSMMDCNGCCGFWVVVYSSVSSLCPGLRNESCKKNWWLAPPRCTSETGTTVAQNPKRCGNVRIDRKEPLYVERSIAISTRVFWMNVGLERPSKTLGKHVLSENTNTISIDEVNREIVVSWKWDVRGRRSDWAIFRPGSNQTISGCIRFSSFLVVRSHLRTIDCCKLMRIYELWKPNRTNWLST